MHGVQHNDHHHPAYALQGVQDCGYTLQTNAMGSEDRTCVGATLHGAGRGPVKLRMSSGRGLVAKSVPPKASSYGRNPLVGFGA